jgi:hypothetical protein
MSTLDSVADTNPNSQRGNVVVVVGLSQLPLSLDDYGAAAKAAFEGSFASLIPSVRAADVSVTSAASASGADVAVTVSVRIRFFPPDVGRA